MPIRVGMTEWRHGHVSINAAWFNVCLIVLAVFAAQSTAGAELRCPAALDGHAYARASVFDGPPAQEADLIPDSTSGGTDVWQLGYIFDDGREPYLVCRYDGTGKTVTFRLQRPMTTCISPEKPRTVICR